MDGTLSSILSIKTHNPQSRSMCFKWRPDQDLLKLSRKAAKAYNGGHKSMTYKVLTACFLQDLVGGWILVLYPRAKACQKEQVVLTILKFTLSADDQH